MCWRVGWRVVGKQSWEGSCCVCCGNTAELFPYMSMKRDRENRLNVPCDKKLTVYILKTCKLYRKNMYKWIFSQVYFCQENIIGAQWKPSEMIDFRELVHYFLCSWKLYWVVLLAPVVLSELFIRKCLTLTQQQRSCVLDSKEFPSFWTRHWGSGFCHSHSNQAAAD